MIRSIIAAAAVAVAFGSGGAQSAFAAPNPCYIECQYRCYAVHPGGGAQWEACYLACAEDRCGAVGAP